MFILTILKWVLIVILCIFLATILLVAYLLILPVFYDIEIDFNEKSFEIHSKDFLRLYNIGISRKNKKINGSLKLLFGLLNLSPKNESSKSKDKTSHKENKELKVEIPEIKESGEDENIQKPENSKKDEKKKEKSKKRKEKLKKLLKEKETYEAFKYAILETFKTLKKLLPREFYAKIDFSLGRPDLTGLLTGGLSILPFIYQNDSKVIPDFLSEKAYINGFLKIKGYFALGNFIVLMVKLILNRQIRRILQTLL